MYSLRYLFSRFAPGIWPTQAPMDNSGALDIRKDYWTGEAMPERGVEYWIKIILELSSRITDNDLRTTKWRAISSVGLEHYLDKVGVTGSSPVLPTFHMNVLVNGSQPMDTQSQFMFCWAIEVATLGLLWHLVVPGRSPIFRFSKENQNTPMPRNHRACMGSFQRLHFLYAGFFL